jgi:hypothetical protein
MGKHQVSCNVAGCVLCGFKPIEMEITYADTSPPCPTCAVKDAVVERLREGV